MIWVGHVACMEEKNTYRILVGKSEVKGPLAGLRLGWEDNSKIALNPLKPELNPICYLLALLGAHHFLHVSRIRVKLLTLR
jgi:transposase